MKRSLVAGAVVGALALITAGLTGGPARAVAGSTISFQAATAAVARGLARAHGATYGLDGRQGLVTKDVTRDSDGTQHVRFDRTFDGLPVLGGDLVVHSDRTGAWRGTDAAARSVSVASTTPSLSAGRAAALARAHFGGHSATSTPHLAVDALGGSPRLAWTVAVRGVAADQTPYGWKVLVDATTGAVSVYGNEVETAEGIGVHDGPVTIGTSGTDGAYTMVDAARGGQSTYDMGNQMVGTGTLFTNTDDVWGDGTQSNRASAAVDAQYGAAQTWDFFLNRFGRNGIKNDGQGAQSRVHYGTGYENAFWNDQCFCMTYGDGSGDAMPFTALDVAGHEMSHGVTSATANLAYTGESGGLNEATSDIFGSMVEFQAENPKDLGNYMIGEQLNLFGDGRPLRWMDKPSKDLKSADCWSSAVGGLDVHYSSGVANHFFYLLSEGSGAKTINGVHYNSPTCNHSRIRGIGRWAASAIWYRALTTYMTSTTDYAGARTATLEAARDLYGGRSRQHAAVAAAWSAVSVG